MGCWRPEKDIDRQKVSGPIKTYKRIISGKKKKKKRQLTKEI